MPTFLEHETPIQSWLWKSASATVRKTRSRLRHLAKILHEPQQHVLSIWHVQGHLQATSCN